MGVRVRQELILIGKPMQKITRLWRVHPQSRAEHQGIGPGGINLRDRNDATQHWRERKYRRFVGNFPVQVRFHFKDSVSELQAVTNNVSVGGFLLQTISPIPQNCVVSFTMTLHGGTVIRPLQIAGEGKVISVEPHPSGTGFAIAVKCKTPMSQIPQNFTKPLS